jgi:hypothetical protein
MTALETALEVEAARRAAALERLAKTEPGDVASYYTGRPGCACGCRGTYRYSEAHREMSGERRGYSVSDDEVVKPASVKRMLTMLRKRLEDEEEVEVVAFDEFTVSDGEGGWWVELNNHSADNGERVYIVRCA